MRIHELFEADIGQTKRTTTKAKQDISSEPIDDYAPKNVLGRGAYAFVKDYKPSGGQEVVRRPFQSEYVAQSKDPNHWWAEIVADYNQKNPLGNRYLPMIHSIKTRKGTNEFTRTETVISKYLNGYDQEPEMLYQMAERMFPRFREIYQIYSDQYKNQSQSTILWKLIIKAIQMNYARGKAINPVFQTSDKQLVEALDLIHFAIDEYAKTFKAKSQKFGPSISFDLHMDNIMFTNPQTGGQVVFTDPLGD